MDPGNLRATAFAGLFRDAFDDVLRFCARRVAPERAEDLAAETMAIAWRRFDDLPPGGATSGRGCSPPRGT